MADYPNFSETFPLFRHEGDLKGRMKPGALLRYAQQIATDQGNRIGLTNEFYRENHLAYLLARQSLEFTRIPLVDEVLTYTTVPERSRRACNKRLTLVTDAQGREVACVDSRWILVDIDTRRIVRRPPASLDDFWNESVERALSQRIPKAQALQSAGLRRADYSLCDLNGHLNNTCYVDLACDLLPQQPVLERGVGRVAVVYHREVPFGESLELLYGPAEEGAYVCGMRGGLPAFEAWCGFAEAAKPMAENLP